MGQHAGIRFFELGDTHPAIVGLSSWPVDGFRNKCTQWARPPRDSTQAISATGPVIVAWTVPI
ncbi:hypothetical protein AB0L99_22225, partial [Streptomyces sp. NPDC051954]|uniref:hypothetical protein n=1 Tax=Streptomyces sp. NPDC051954 TaxID=3155524 RepID=UPI00343C62E0